MRRSAFFTQEAPISTVKMPAAIAAAAKNAVCAPEYIVVKEKLPVSFAFRLTVPTGPPAAPATNPVVQSRVNATAVSSMAKGNLKASQAISSGHKDATRSLAAGGVRWRVRRPARKESG